MGGRGQPCGCSIKCRRSWTDRGCRSSGGVGKRADQKGERNDRQTFWREYYAYEPGSRSGGKSYCGRKGSHCYNRSRKSGKIHGRLEGGRGEGNPGSRIYSSSKTYGALAAQMQLWQREQKPEDILERSLQ